MSNLDEPLFGTPVRYEVCRGCRYSHGEPPWADDPDKAYCMVYRREDGMQKPRELERDDAICEYRDPE